MSEKIRKMAENGGKLIIREQSWKCPWKMATIEHNWPVKAVNICHGSGYALGPSGWVRLSLNPMHAWPMWLPKFTRNMGWRWMELSWLSSLKAKTRSIRQVVACFLMKSWDFCTTCHGGAWTCAWEIASQSQFVYVSRSSVRERGRWGGGEGLSDDQRANLVLNF